MNPLSLNPKTLHIIAELAQIGGTLGGLSSIVGTFNPVAGTACLALAALATFLKVNVIGNIPSSV